MFLMLGLRVCQEECSWCVLVLSPRSPVSRGRVQHWSADARAWNVQGIARSCRNRRGVVSFRWNLESLWVPRWHEETCVPQDNNGAWWCLVDFAAAGNEE